MGSLFKYLLPYNRIMKALTGKHSEGEVDAGSTPVKRVTVAEHDCLEHLELDTHWLWKWRCKVCWQYWEEYTCKACGTVCPFRVDLPIPEFCSGECEYDYKHCGVRP